ncbi:transcriptional regulator, DeoR family [Fusobacterium equinum]|uniref:Transcriptional regulator, DeoR family n=1 Tax=Fusobacterium equinum TaxID=134605 RepID=A0A133N8B3_9FUSO|nr:DeoR/GlpR family DNA-binding transcription regulator [Fusobacterium equinum]KXA12529.1 transcriptional regulator, DeoR family [Fusobacterium equinum]
MLSSERYQFIVQYLEEHNSATRKELADLLGVTSMTIGRDLKKLEQKGYLVCTYGGAILPNSLVEEKKYDRKKEENTKIKKRIAEKALEEIRSNMTIILDAGTTTYELACLIAQSSIQNLRVITNDLYIALELYQKENIKLILLGGEVARETGATTSVLSIKQIENYNADIAFLGISSISDNLDITVPTEVKAILKRSIMKISEKNILLTDYSKFGKKKLYKAAHIKNFDSIITDHIFSKKEIEKYGLEKKIIQVDGKDKTI